MSTLLFIIFVPIFYIALIVAAPPLLRIALILAIPLTLLMLVVEVLDLVLTAFICVYLWPFVLFGYLNGLPVFGDDGAIDVAQVDGTAWTYSTGMWLALAFIVFAAYKAGGTRQTAIAHASTGFDDIPSHDDDPPPETVVIREGGTSLGDRVIWHGAAAAIGLALGVTLHNRRRDRFK